MAVVNQRVDHHPHYNHISLELHNTEVQEPATSTGPLRTAILGGMEASGRPTKTHVLT